MKYNIMDWRHAYPSPPSHETPSLPAIALFSCSPTSVFGLALIRPL